MQKMILAYFLVSLFLVDHYLNRMLSRLKIKYVHYFKVALKKHKAKTAALAYFSHFHDRF